MSFFTRISNSAQAVGQRFSEVLWPERRQLASELSRLEATRRRLMEAIDLLPEGIVILDEERRYVAWKSQYATIYAGTADQIRVGRKLEDAVRTGLARGEYPEAIGREEAWLEERLRKLWSPGPRHEQTLADGRCYMIEDRLLADGGLLSLRVDITEMKQREASFRLLFENNPLPMFVCDVETWEILSVNKAAVQHYGYGEARLKSMSFRDVHCAVDRTAGDSLSAAGASSFSGRSFRHVRANGNIIEVELRASELPYGGKPAVLVASIDVTERRLNEYRVLHSSRHDHLTSLPNRALLNERLHSALEKAEPLALLFLDLDNFKPVNDTLGHGAGDELLRTVSGRLKSCVRKRDLVARLGGDEFAIIAYGCDAADDLSDLCNRILDELHRPVLIGGREVQVSASIGVALAPSDAANVSDLVRLSDLALYAAKAAGKHTFCFFDPSLAEKVTARAMLEAELRNAVNGNELVLFYQPIVDIDTREVICREALIRWQHPVRGLIPPAEFIPLAEETGLIVPIGEYVMRQACKDAASWPDAVRVSVNLSSLELNDLSIVARVKSCLEEASLEPSRLQIEVTETAVMSNVTVATGLLSSIRELGVEIVMDDFGTGYSSLSFLRKAPFDKLKIDKSFIRDLKTAEGRTVLAAIMQMANALDLKTTAEGVETQVQLETLENLGCGEVQGYLFGRPEPIPVPPADLLEGAA